MLPLSPLRFSTIGKPILRTFDILKVLRFFDNSSRTRAKAKATARAMARATAMATATARARRTRARARARDGRTDGRPDGAIYLAKCATPPQGYGEPAWFPGLRKYAEPACPKKAIWGRNGKKAPESAGACI